MSHLSVPGQNTTDQMGTIQADDGDTNDLFDFDHIPADGDLFDNTNSQGDPAYNYGFDGTGYDDSGRVIEQLTDSEATSPTVTENPEVVDDGGSATKRRRKA
ncbi:hypothetical protein N7499_001453 [Penicillium canescens]|nr:hypothetical protein N7499_001453 [Penicillium canescens]